MIIYEAIGPRLPRWLPRKDGAAIRSKNFVTGRLIVGERGGSVTRTGRLVIDVVLVAQENVCRFMSACAKNFACRSTVMPNPFL
jgi:hypothetical protein